MLIMACFYLSPIAGFVTIALFTFVMDFVGYFYFPTPLFLLLAILVSLGAWFWGLIDAYKGAEAHNARHGLH